MSCRGDFCIEETELETTTTKTQSQEKRRSMLKLFARMLEEDKKKESKANSIETKKKETIPV